VTRQNQKKGHFNKNSRLWYWHWRVCAKGVMPLPSADQWWMSDKMTTGWGSCLELASML